MDITMDEDDFKVAILAFTIVLVGLFTTGILLFRDGLNQIWVLIGFVYGLWNILSLLYAKDGYSDWSIWKYGIKKLNYKDKESFLVMRKLPLCLNYVEYSRHDTLLKAKTQIRQSKPVAYWIKSERDEVMEEL